ncbi:M16 family metallopeptidase [Georgfuchsia toluolica]|nr:pitrilysin family protein [Georgfuchsia toluolica]
MLLGAMFAAGAVHANPFETTLPNGFHVIVKEDHRAPTAVQIVWYRAGSIDEKDGSSGLAHALEHLMFKGTKKVKPGEFSKLVAAAGGRDNAFTSRDYTAYFEQVPARALPEMMMLEADRMANLQIPQKEYDPEIKVVMEERRLRTEDDPTSLVHEALNSMAFQAHPYRRPVIGWMDDLEHMNRADAEQWYKTWYAPNNALLVIAGDVSHEAVFHLAAKYYGSIKPHALPERKPQNEPEQKGKRCVVVKAPARLPYVALAWKVPKLKDVDKDREPYALQVLAAVLDGNEASRLAKNLVRGQKIAQSAGAGYDSTVRGETLFVLDGQPAEGHTVAELEAALRGEIKRIQDEGVSAEELARIKTQTIASQVFKRDSVMGQAMEIGMLEAIGMDWRDIDKMQDKVRSVTADEVQVVAKKYFGDDTLTVATLDPQPIAENAAPKKPVIHHH